MTGLRERLRARALPSESVRFPADSQAWAAAHERLEEASAALQDALRRGPAPSGLQQQYDDAKAAVDGLAVTEFVVRALSPADWEALVGQHPPADEKADWNAATFYPAMLAETVTMCTKDGPESASPEEWIEMFRSGDGLTLGEKNTLINTALRLNTTASLVSPSVGKGSAQTRS